MTHMTVIPLIIIIRIITRSKAQTGLEDAGTEFATSVKNIAYDNKIVIPNDYNNCYSPDINVFFDESTSVPTSGRIGRTCIIGNDNFIVVCDIFDTCCKLSAGIFQSSLCLTSRNDSNYDKSRMEISQYW
jgi:hypothetical protein